jgi:hypothetical protein
MKPLEPSIDNRGETDIIAKEISMDPPSQMATEFPLFDFDLFSSLYDPIPLLPTSEPPVVQYDQSQAHVFDEIARSRLLYSLKDVPPNFKGALPPSSELTTFLQQYFCHCSTLAPIPHVPSFSVRECPPILLLLCLGIGDSYSSVVTVGRWARSASRYLLRSEIDCFEKSGESLPVTTLQAMGILLLDSAYAGEHQQILEAYHLRVTLAAACRKLQEEEEDNNEIETEDEAGWIMWIGKETRRRTLLQIYLTEISITMHHGGNSMFQLSEFSVFLPSPNQLWTATSAADWVRFKRSDPTGLRFNQIIPDLLTERKLLSNNNDTIHLAVVSLGLYEIGSIVRRMSNPISESLLGKAREIMTAWKSSWQSKETFLSRPQYLLVMSAWCSTDLYLSAPDFVLETMHKIFTMKDLTRSREYFLKAADVALQTVEASHLVAAARATLLQVEILSGFHSVEDCISTIRAAVYPNVVGSIFLGGLCLWFIIHVLRQKGQPGLEIETGIISRVTIAMSAFGWADHMMATDTLLTAILGELLVRTKAWGMRPLFYC